MLKILIVAFLIILTPLTSLAFRYGNRLVTYGMSKGEVIEICGLPIYTENTGVLLKGNRVVFTTTWLIDMERGAFKRIILWEGDKIVEIKLGERKK